ncbi:MAG: recombinase family protein, partial [Lachnospiraceae bacterium]|nr:recombinase family protein [Lachnospiraceae bacterium]
DIAAGLEADGIKSGTGATKWYKTTVIGILKNEKHMGDALLQKTYTADFMTKRQVRNNGEVAQVYITDDHEAIIDRETWEAVQEEFKRREEFMARHNLKIYTHASGNTPFTCRVFCGTCGKSYMRHIWKRRGITQWQCSGHRKDGRLLCRNDFVDEQDLMRGFVKAYNKLMSSKRKLKEWRRLADTGTPLQRVRGRQMIELAAEKPLSAAVDDLIRLVVLEVTVHSGREFTFAFMDGSQVRVQL